MFLIFVFFVLGGFSYPLKRRKRKEQKTMTEEIDKSNIISPYACKHESEIEGISKSLDRIDKKIDLLIDINSQLKVQGERINALEKRQQEITTRLWYVCGATIIAIITAIIQVIK